jgi:hypothetical protein
MQAKTGADDGPACLDDDDARVAKADAAHLVHGSRDVTTNQRVTADSGRVRVGMTSWRRERRDDAILVCALSAACR